MNGILLIKSFILMKNLIFFLEFLNIEFIKTYEIKNYLKKSLKPNVIYLDVVTTSKLSLQFFVLFLYINQLIFIHARNN